MLGTAQFSMLMLMMLMMIVLLKNDFEAHAGYSKEAKAHWKFSCQGTQADCQDQISPGHNSFRKIDLPENFS